MQTQTAETNLTLTSLHPYYTYTVLVLAFTVAPGPFSTAVTVKTPQEGQQSSYYPQLQNEPVFHF